MSEQTKQCPYCAETIKADAIICRFCNRDVSGNVPVTQKAEVQKPRKKNTARNIIIAVIVSVGVVCCVLTVAGLMMDTSAPNEIVPSSPGTTNQDAASSGEVESGEDVSVEPPPTETPLPFAPPIEEILATVDGMTDAQRNNYNETLRGNIIENWTGTITDVDEGEILGGFTVYVDMIDSNFGAEVHIKVTEEVALSLNKDQKIVFSGEIDHVSDIFGTTVFVENATIESAE